MKKVEVVATVQHEWYGASVKAILPKASLVWDRFHLLQRFDEALNEERKEEALRVSGREHYGDLLSGKYRFLFLKKELRRVRSEKERIEEVMSLNWKIARLELIKKNSTRCMKQKQPLKQSYYFMKPTNGL